MGSDKGNESRCLCLITIWTPDIKNKNFFKLDFAKVSFGWLLFTMTDAGKIPIRFLPRVRGVLIPCQVQGHEQGCLRRMRGKVTMRAEPSPVPRAAPEQ